jgi:hypothetical protein
MNFVLIQLGNKPPKFFWMNVKHLHRSFPQSLITVISDSQQTLDRAIDFDCDTYLYAQSDQVKQIFNNHAYAKDFRNGFWQYSSIRLFALLDYVSSSNARNVLHLESDVLLFANFPLKQVKSHDGLMWCNYNEQRDVAAIMYVPNSNYAQWMLSKLYEIYRLDSKQTDMSALRALALSYPQKISYFDGGFKKLSNKQSDHKIDPDFERNPFGTELEGVFDGATIGMWLTGEDPRNHKGYLVRLNHLNEGNIDLRTLKFNIRECGLSAYKEGIQIPIYNLHIHSKNRMLFSPLNLQLLKLYVFLANINCTVKIFQPKIFLGLLSGRIKRIARKLCI